MLSIVFLTTVLSCSIGSQEPMPFKYENKYGYLDKDLKVIISPKYDRASHFEGNYAIVREAMGDAFIIDTKGTTIFTAKTNLITHVVDDIYSYKLENKNTETLIRVKDKTILIEGLGGIASSYGDNLILVNFMEGNSRYGYINFEGKRVFQDLVLRRPSYAFSEGRAIVTLNDWNYGIIDNQGNILRSGDLYRIGQRYVEGLVPVQKNDKITGYLNKEGDFAFQLPIVIGDVPEATDFNNGLALIMVQQAPCFWRIIDNHGNYISENIIIDHANEFSDGMSLVYKKDEKTGKIQYGYINTKGEFIVDVILDSGGKFKNGYAQIVFQGRDGILNVKGEVFWSDEIIRGKAEPKRLK